MASNMIELTNIKQTHVAAFGQDAITLIIKDNIKIIILSGLCEALAASLKYLVSHQQSANYCPQLFQEFIKQ